METSPFRMLRQKAVAEMLGMTESWVEQIRLKGGGPAFCKFGKSVRYKIEDILEWIEMRRCTSTSEYTAQSL